MIVERKDREPFHVGLAWDEYTPAVEGQLLRDVLALVEEADHHGRQLQVVATSDEADRMLKTLGVARTSLVNLPEVWRTYKTGPRPVALPEGAQWSTPIVADLYVHHSKTNNLMREGDGGYPLKDQGRDNPYNPYDRAAPANRSGISSQNPLVNWIWSGP